MKDMERARVRLHTLIMFTVVCSFFLFTSCITNKQKAYLQPEDVSAYKFKDFEQYRLCVNDEIFMYLMTADQETQYLYNSGMQSGGTMSTGSSVYRIYDDGNVVLPTVGGVKISGLSLREAEQVLTGAYRKMVVDDAEVKLVLANNFYYVQGDHGKGRFSLYKEKLNIFEALAMAGDISSTGDKEHVKVIRRGVDGLDQVHTIDLRKASIVESEYYYIYPNDVIYIPTNSSSFFRVESVSSFVSMFVAPISLLVLVLSLF